MLCFILILVPATSIKMLNGSSSDSFSDGSEVDLSLGVASHIFQCEVPGINPQATFTWTVGGTSCHQTLQKIMLLTRALAWQRVQVKLHWNQTQVTMVKTSFAKQRTMKVILELRFACVSKWQIGYINLTKDMQVERDIEEFENSWLHYGFQT